jgi:aldose 1-epimerase
MPYQITEEPFGTIAEFVLENTLTGESCRVVPAFGGIVRELKLKANSQIHSLIDCPDSYESMQINNNYQSAILFPFPSRIPDGKFTFEGASYQLPINEPARGNAIHGFVHGSVFEVINQATHNDTAILSLLYKYNGELSGYPFPFELTINYILMPNVLGIEFEVKNTGKNTMPAAFGWHPYFKFDGVSVDDLSIEIQSKTTVTFDQNMIPTGKVDFENKGLIELKNKILDNCFVVDTTQKLVTTRLIDSKKNIKLSISQDVARFPYLVVYTPNSRDRVAIEPLTSNVNALNTGEGLMTLKPKQIIDGSIWISLS